MNESVRLSRGQQVKRIVGLVLGVVLLALAIGYAVRDVDFSVVGRAPWWMIAALAGLVVVNLLLTSALFWMITRSFDATPKVTLRTMTALLAVSGVLNYIPVVRAGLWGRAGYLKKFHGLAVRDSVLILAVVFGLALGVLGSVVLLLILSPDGWAAWSVAGGLVVLTPISAVACRQVLRRPLAVGWVWVPLRALDLAAAAGRLWFAFAVVGVELGWTEAVLLASATLIVKLVGLTPNGLGLSEWVVAALSAAMMPIETTIAAAAALVDRSVEMVVALLAGGVASWWLHRETSSKTAVT